MKKKWLFLTLIAGAAVMAAVFIWNEMNGETEFKASVQPTAMASKGSIKVSVSGSGTISTKYSKTVTASGNKTVKEVLVKEGDLVKAGQTLLVFEKDDVSGKIRQTEISQKQQNMNLEDLKKRYIQAANDSERDSIGLSLEKAKLDIEELQLQMNDYYEQQAETDEVTAPIDGTIVELTVAVGDMIGQNTQIAKIIDYDQLETVVQVDELDISKIAAGQKAVITVDALANASIDAVVSKVAMEGKSSNGVALFDVTVDLPKSEGIRSGMSVQTEIVINQKDDILIVPIEAVHELRGSKYVMIADAGSDGGGADRLPNSADDRTSWGGRDQAEMPQRAGMSQGEEMPQRAEMPQTAGDAAIDQTMRPVEVGINNESYIEIISGLQAGERVLLPAVTGSSSSQMQMPSGFGGFGGNVMNFGGGGTGAGSIRIPGGGER